MAERFPAPRAVAGRALLAACLLVLMGAGEARAAVTVWFVQGEQLTAVNRPGTTAADALGALVAGPTRRERRRGVRTDIPGRVTQRGYTVAGQRAIVDVPAAFFGTTAGTPAARARLVQLVRSLVGLPGSRRSPWTITRVQLLVDGQVAPGVVPGVDTSVPVTPASLAAPDPAVVPAVPSVATAPNPWLLTLQARLAALGYLDPSDIDGYPGRVTEAAVLAFQKWEGLGRDGMVGQQTAARLQVATRPTPRTRARGTRVEVLLDRQLVLAIRDGRVVRTMHAATGTAATPTPSGSFRVDGKFPRWWSIPYGEWLPWSVRFAPGIALHSYASVPPVPSSHGCVRMIDRNAKWIYGFATSGTPVRVLTTSGATTAQAVPSR